MRVGSIAAVAWSKSAGLGRKFGVLGILSGIALPFALDAGYGQQPARTTAAMEGSRTQTLAGLSTGAESEISFVGVVSYKPGGDGEYAYSIEPQDDGLSYAVSTSGAENAGLRLAVTTIPLPPETLVQRSIHSVGPGRSEDPIRIPPPPAGSAGGIALLEVLGYEPGRNGGYSYSAHVDDDGVTVEQSGSEDGQVTFRVTRLDWPEAMAPDMDAGCSAVRATADGYRQRESLVDVLAVSIPAPTTYWTEGGAGPAYAAAPSWTPQRHFNDLSLTGGSGAVVELTLCWMDFRSGTRASEECRMCEARAISACQDNGGVDAYWDYSEASGRSPTGCRARCGEGMLLGRPSGTARQCYSAPLHFERR